METAPDSAAKPWLAHYPVGVPAHIDVARLGTIADVIRDCAARFASAPAYESFGVRLSFAETLSRANAVTAWLQSRGLAKGDRVAIMMPNVMAYPVAMFGALLGGYTVVNVNPLYTPRELTHQIEDSGAKVLFVLENFAHVVEAAWPDLDLTDVVLCSAGDVLGWKGRLVDVISRHVKKLVKPFTLSRTTRLATVLAQPGAPRPTAISGDDLAFLQYTGGTTGVAKGAMLTHRNVAANLAQTNAWVTPSLSPTRHVMITALPLYHIFALTCCCFYPWTLGACSVLVANPRDLDGFIKTLRGVRFTMISGVNTLFNALLNHPKFSSVDFSQLFFCGAGGMAMQEVVARRWKEVTGRTIVEGYGLSETSPILTMNPVLLDAFSGTIGFPLPSTDIVIRAATGEDAPAGAPGELCARGPQVMKGYWKRPDETAKAMSADGYFRTGDVAVMEPDGQLRIVDRIKDMILVSGFNVYPNEVESVLAAHPGVLECAVVGMPDTHSGEAVAAYVVRRDPNLTADALRHFARERLTGYKAPRLIIFRDVLPKSNVGKVLRRALRDEAPGERAEAQ